MKFIILLILCFLLSFYLIISINANRTLIYSLESPVYFKYISPDSLPEEILIKNEIKKLVQTEIQFLRVKDSKIMTGSIIYVPFDLLPIFADFNQKILFQRDPPRLYLCCGKINLLFPLDVDSPPGARIQDIQINNKELKIKYQPLVINIVSVVVYGILLLIWLITIFII